MRRNDIITSAIQKSHTAGHEQALSRVFASLGRVFAAQLGIVPPTVTKSHTPKHPAEPAPPEADPHAALLLAQLDHLIRCHESKHDHKPGYKALHALWHDPESLAGVLSPHVELDKHVQKALAVAIFLKSAEHAPKGGISLSGKHFAGGMWIPAKVVANATSEERKYLDSQRKESDPRTKKDSLTREKSRKQIADVAADIIRKPEERTPDKYRDLAESAAAAIEAGHLSIADMRALRIKLGSALGESPRQNDMTATLANHATADSPLTAVPSAEAGPPKPNTFAVVPLDALSIDPAQFQFKQKTNAAGVTAELSKVKSFNPDFAGVIAVWFDPATGKTFVVNGHHRFDLAKRTGYPTLAVHYLDAKDAREARAKGALINIAEGRGTAIDAAKFLRDSGRTAQDLFDHGVSPDGVVARDAAVLTHLNDAAFDRLARGGLSLPTALAVAKHLADPTRQEKLFKLIQRKEDEGKDFTNRHVEEMARQMAAAPSTTTTTSSLFGEDTSEDDSFLERADLASHIRGELSKEHHDYGALASTRRAEATQEAGNVLNVGENKKRALEADVHRSAFDTLAHRRGPVADALDAGSVAVKQARTRKEKESARNATLGNVRTALAAIASGKLAPAAEQQGMGEVGTGSPLDSGGEPEAPTPPSAGQTADHGSGTGNGPPRLDATSPALAGAPQLGPRGTWIPGASTVHPPRVSPTSATSPAIASLPTGDAPFPPQWIPGAPAGERKLSSPNVVPPPKAEAGGTASPLHALAHFAHDPAALRAESEHLRDTANKTKAQGGNLEFHDAMTAALRGEHGSDVRDAVSRALDDWDGHQGDTAKRYARVAEEVAKLTKKPEAELGTEAKPQAEAAQAASPATESEIPLGGKKVRETPGAPPESRAYLANISPDETDVLQRYTTGAFGGLNSRLRQYGAEGGHGDKVHRNMQAVMDRTPEFPEPVTVHRGTSLNPAELAKFEESAKFGKPVGNLGYLSGSIDPNQRFEGNVVFEIAAKHGIDVEPVGASGGEHGLSEMVLDSKSKYRVASVEKKGGKYHVKMEQLPREPLGKEKVSEHDLPSEEEFAAASKPYTPPERATDKLPSPNETDLTQTPVADIPVAVAAEEAKAKPKRGRAAVSVPSGGAGGSTTGSPASRKRGRKPEHRAEQHKYSVDSGRAITQTPDMSRAESAANAAANPTLPTRPGEVHPHARAIRDIPVGDSRYVAGHRVRRTGEDSFQTEKRGGFLTGTADDIAKHIGDSLGKQQGFESLPGALSRADAYAEPDPFTDLARSDSDAKMRSAVPDGARGVSLDENTRGRIGTVRHDPLTGRTWLQFDGSTEERGHDFEPLDAAHSWRASEEERAVRKPKGGKTESLFGDDTEA